MDSDPDQPELTPPSRELATSLVAAAQGRVRAWTASADPEAALAGIGALARDEIVAAGELIARIAALPAGTGAERELAALRAAIEQIHAPPPRRRLFGLVAAPEPGIEQRLAQAEPAIAATLDRLSRERDALARTVVTARSLAARLGEADRGLEHAVHLLGAVDKACQAAARELAGADPRRAQIFHGEVAARLLERRRDILTQLVVLRQARLALGILIDGQDALARAIDRLRHTMVAALRTAVLAARAITDGARMGERASALDAADARRTIDASLAEMRQALAA